MNKLFYFLGPVFLAGMVAAATWGGLRFLMPEADAYTVPVTFSDGAVLTAAQLNSVNTTAANAFNGHDHSGTDGEASTLAFTALSTTSLTFPSAFTMDATDQGTIFGSGTGTGTETSGPGITIKANTGDPRMTLMANNSSSNAWNFIVDNSATDALEIDYGGSKQVIIDADGGIATDGNDDSHAIAWEIYTGTTCNPQPCTTVVDTSSPGSNFPWSFTCLVEAASQVWRPCNSISLCLAQFEEAGDDLELIIDDDDYQNSSYRCIVIYPPS